MHRIQADICNARSFEKVKTYIREFELDDRDLKQEDFMTMCKDEQLLAFARVRDFIGFSELCSLGVIEKARHHGLASRLVKTLSDKSKQPLYLVSVIPDFFTSLGFEICENFPPEICEKLEYCNSVLSTPETYVVMRLG